LLEKYNCFLTKFKYLLRKYAQAIVNQPIQSGEQRSINALTLMWTTVSALAGRAPTAQ
jgi:hypothetical protein